MDTKEFLIGEQVAFINYLRLQVSEKNEEISRLREALGFYANLSNYEEELIEYPSPRLVGTTKSNVRKDVGEIARQAMEVKK